MNLKKEKLSQRESQFVLVMCHLMTILVLKTTAKYQINFYDTKWYKWCSTVSQSSSSFCLLLSCKMEKKSSGLRMSSYNRASSSLLSFFAFSVSRPSPSMTAGSMHGQGALWIRSRRLTTWGALAVGRLVNRPRFLMRFIICTCSTVLNLSLLPFALLLIESVSLAARLRRVFHLSNRWISRIIDDKFGKSSTCKTKLIWKHVSRFFLGW